MSVSCKHQGSPTESRRARLRGRGGASVDPPQGHSLHSLSVSSCLLSGKLAIIIFRQICILLIAFGQITTV